MPGVTTIVGSIEIDGEPSLQATRLAATLARNGLWPGGPIEVVEKTDDRVSFTSLGSLHNPHGEIRILPTGKGRTRFEYTVEYEALRRYLKGGWTIQAFGLIVLAVIYWVLRTYVVTNPNPAVRWQSVQMAQCVHLLWPPFLMGHLYRS